MAVQDDERERQLLMLFNLEQDEERKRHGIDGQLELDGELTFFELKSTSKGSVATVRDFGADHVRKWHDLHWIIGNYAPGRDSLDLQYCYYASPHDMRPWIAEKWEYVRPDYLLAERTPQRVTAEDMHQLVGQKEHYSLADARSVQKRQLTVEQYRARMDLYNGYSPAAMLTLVQDRAAYLLERGATLNNPAIPKSYFKGWEKITRNHAAVLRAKVRAARTLPDLPRLV